MNIKNDTFWDKRSGKYEEAVKEHDAQYGKTLTRAKALLGGSDVVLDLACATGEFSLDIAPDVQRIHGIDTSGKMIGMAKEKASIRQAGKISFNHIDEFDADLARNSFSAIVAFSIFHLIEDVSKTLARLHELTSAGGLLITETPCAGERGWIFKSFLSVAQKLEVAPFIRNFTIRELE